MLHRRVICCLEFFFFFVRLPQPLCTKEVENKRIAARDWCLSVKQATSAGVCYQAKSFLSLLVHFPLQAALKAKKHHKWWGHQHCCKWFAVPEQPCCRMNDGAGMSSIKVANCRGLQREIGQERTTAEQARCRQTLLVSRSSVKSQHTCHMKEDGKCRHLQLLSLSPQSTTHTAQKCPDWNAALHMRASFRPISSNPSCQWFILTQRERRWLVAIRECYPARWSLN